MQMKSNNVVFSSGDTRLVVSPYSTDASPDMFTNSYLNINGLQ